MKILVITNDGLALGIAQRLSYEEHDVDVFYNSTDVENPTSGTGLYNRSTNLWKSVQECKFIVTDHLGSDALYERAKTYNKPIIGCNPLTDMVNRDALKEYELGRRLGVAFPPSEVFDDAVGLHPKLLEGTKTRYYIKQGRKVFPCTKPEWLAWSMYQLPPGHKVLLQEEVIGHDVEVVGWFNGLNWIKPFFYSTPYADRIGGVAMLAIKKPSKLTLKSLSPLGRWLKTIDYKGPVTASLICTKDQVYVRSFKIGFTAPCVFAMIEGLKELPLGDFLHLLAFGTDAKVNVTNDYLVGVEVHCKSADMHGAPILGIIPDNLRHVFLGSVMRDAEDSYLVSNDMTHVYTATAHGRDMQEATRRVYATVGEIQFPRSIYMTNLLGQTSITFEKLKSWSVI